MTPHFTVHDFVAESNRIEGIVRAPTHAELAEFRTFIALPVITVDELCRFVSVNQPNAVLRDRIGLDVYVGNHRPPPGHPLLRDELVKLLQVMIEGKGDPASAYRCHIAYELLHPFTDCNGRSGRALWAWQMGPLTFDYGFLHMFYYQTLRNFGALNV